VLLYEVQMIDVFEPVLGPYLNIELFLIDEDYSIVFGDRFEGGLAVCHIFNIVTTDLACNHRSFLNC